MSDFICYGLLIVLTYVCLSSRTAIPYFLLRYGVEESLVSGFAGQTSSGVELNLNEITTIPMLVEYFSGPFDYQVFNTNSSLRQFYTPVGNARARLQKVKSKLCTRPDIPLDLKKSCFYVQVNPQTQEQEDIQFPPSVLPDLLAKQIYWKGQPGKWAKASANTAELPGYIQPEYDGSGYSIFFNVNPNRIHVHSFAMEVPWMSSVWLSSETRLFT
ncbi:unnamed protein product, partial [Polarella glacialis]